MRLFALCGRAMGRYLCFPSPLSLLLLSSFYTHVLCFLLSVLFPTFLDGALGNDYFACCAVTLFSFSLRLIWRS